MGGGSGFFPEGGRQEGSVAANHRIVNGAYFSALRIPIIAGRSFMDSDRRDRPVVAVVSQSFADRAWPHQNPLGRRFTWGRPAADNPSITVVGVAGDVRLARTVAPTPHVYLAFTQVPEYVTSDVAVRVDGDPRSMTAAVRAVIHQVDPDQPVAHIAPYDDVLADSVGRRRFTLMLMAVFASLALLLAAVGLYGVVAFFVNRRTREIGVRLALGATHTRVRGSVMRDGLWLVTIGVFCGGALSIVGGRWAAAWLPGVARFDALSLAAAIAMVLLTAVIACDIPARHASRINPVTALRAD
jgi:predicted permease